MASFATIDDVIRRALEIAQHGRGRVEPNPMVGAVIVNDRLELIAEGWHHAYGGPHAEVHALEHAKEHARGATLVVTLEPCNHSGKTPPCTEAILRSGVSRVVIGAIDPATHSDMSGIARLRQAGIAVEMAPLSRECQRLILPFRRLQVDQRPWIHAKWAMSWDGKLATRSQHSQWISGEESRAVVHQLRGVCDAILVGIETVLADDPLLSARPAGPRVATRVVLDSQLRLPRNSKLVTSSRDLPLCVVTSSCASADRRRELEDHGIEVLAVSTDRNGQLEWLEVLREFGNRRWTNLLVEGGSRILGSLFDHGFVDEAHVFIAPKLIGGQDARSPFGGIGLDRVPATSQFSFREQRILGDDIYLHGIRED